MPSVSSKIMTTSDTVIRDTADSIAADPNTHTHTHTQTQTQTQTDTDTDTDTWQRAETDAKAVIFQSLLASPLLSSPLLSLCLKPSYTSSLWPPTLVASGLRHE